MIHKDKNIKNNNINNLIYRLDRLKLHKKGEIFKNIHLYNKYNTIKTV